MTWHIYIYICVHSFRVDVAPPVRALALRLLSTLAAAAPNVNANVIVGYFMVRAFVDSRPECSFCIQHSLPNIQCCVSFIPQETDVYDPLLRLCASRDGGGAEALRREGARLLALLLTWRESRNSYAQRLSHSPPGDLLILLTASARLLTPPRPGTAAAAAAAASAAAQRAAAAAAAARDAAAAGAASAATAALSDAAGAVAGYVSDYVFAGWATPAAADSLLDDMAARRVRACGTCHSRHIHAGVCAC
jgi:hypothetical protein